MRSVKSFLLISAVVLVALVAGAYAQEATYVGNSQCKICHNKKDEGEPWTKWKSEQHAKAFERLSSEEAKAAGQKKGLAKPPAESPECLKCHVTAYDPKTGATPEKILKEDGVQCESCHSPGSLHVADGKKYKSGDKSVNMAVHQTRPKEDTCKKCHNEESPNWDPQRYTLADGKRVGFDFKQAWQKIDHSNPQKKK